MSDWTWEEAIRLSRLVRERLVAGGASGFARLGDLIAPNDLRQAATPSDEKPSPDEQHTHPGEVLTNYEHVHKVWHRHGAATPSDEKRLREALEAIAASGCEASRFAGEDPPVWDRCLDYEYVEERPTGPEYRCFPCTAHAALAETRSDPDGAE